MMGPTGAETGRRTEISRQGDWDTSVQWSRIEQGGLVHLHACARPESDAGSLEEQAASMYENLRLILEENGATPPDVVTEKLFCGDVDRQRAPLESLRREFYDLRLDASLQMPATTFLQQPPCAPGRSCEVQVYAMIHEDGAPVDRRRLALDGGEAASGTLAHTGGYDHVYLSNITGESASSRLSGFEAQARSMFARAEECLRRRGLSFRNVIRTWFYLRDMEKDYAAFNAVRNHFYTEWGLGPLPASTGIQGAVFPTERRCGMDLYALGGSSSYSTRVLHTATMNEPPAYGSAFSRALRLDRNDASIVYVSGTASIDHRGEIMHVGDIESQVERMLYNVQQLLDGDQLGLDSVLASVTYLKSAGFLDAYRRACARHPLLHGVPNTVVVADVCRPQWLCETELVAAGA